MSDYGLITVDLTGVTAEADTALHIQISGGAQFTLGLQQNLSLAGIQGVSGMSLSPVCLSLSVSAGTTLGGQITVFATTEAPAVNLTSNSMDFATSSPMSFDVSWSTNASGVMQGTLMSGLVTLSDFGPE